MGFKSTGNLQDDNDIQDSIDRAKSIQTVSCRYSRSLAEYTFMTDQNCKAGDKAVVFTNGNWNVVTIVEVHDKLRLDNPNIQYTYLVQIVDRTNYDRLICEMHEGRDPGKSRL